MNARDLENLRINQIMTRKDYPKEYSLGGYHKVNHITSGYESGPKPYNKQELQNDSLYSFIDSQATETRIWEGDYRKNYDSEEGQKLNPFASGYGFGITRPYEQGQKISQKSDFSAILKDYSGKNSYMEGHQKGSQKPSFSPTSEGFVIGDIYFEEAEKTHNLSVEKGKLYLKGSTYSWSQEEWELSDTAKTYLLEVETDLKEGAIWLGIGPEKERWANSNKCWTVMIKKNMIWIRDLMFGKQLGLLEEDEIRKKNINLHGLLNVQIKIQQDKKIKLSIQGKEVEYQQEKKKDNPEEKEYQYPYEKFRIGILSWKKQEGTFLQSLTLTEESNEKNSSCV